MGLTTEHELSIRDASEGDVPLILSFIRELAEYERLSHEVTASEEILRETLFAGRRFAEVIIAEESGIPVGFALFFHNYSIRKGRGPGERLRAADALPHRPGRGGTELRTA